MTALYGHTWWGRQWVQALEKDSGLERRRLERGRTFAGQDRVVSLNIDVGGVRAAMRGSRRLNYVTHLDVHAYDDGALRRFAERISLRAGLVAALIEGDLEPGILEAANDAGIDLLPTVHDLRPRCSCPDQSPPCKHAAALAYVVAEAIDDDPFVLLHLRGLDRRSLVPELRRIRGEAADDPIGAGREDAEVVVAATGDDPGEPARDAWLRPRAPLPPVPDPPDVPGRPAIWPEDPPTDAPFDTPGLLALAADAATRAWSQLRGDGDSALSLSASSDLVRRQASEPVEGVPPVVYGSTDGDRSARAEAWRHGGAAALAAMDEPAWRPPIATMASARAAVESVGLPASALTVHQNRITAPGFQLRITHDGTWWRFEKRRGRWQVAAPPADAPDDLVDL